MPRVLAGLLFAGTSTSYALSAFEATANSPTPVLLAFLLIGLYSATFLGIVVGTIRIVSDDDANLETLVRSSLSAAPLWVKILAFGGFALSSSLLYFVAGGEVSVADWGAASATERALIYVSLGSFWGFPLPWVLGYARPSA